VGRFPSSSLVDYLNMSRESPIRMQIPKVLCTHITVPNEPGDIIELLDCVYIVQKKIRKYKTSIKTSHKIPLN